MRTVFHLLISMSLYIGQIALIITLLMVTSLHTDCAYAFTVPPFNARDIPSGSLTPKLLYELNTQCFTTKLTLPNTDYHVPSWAQAVMVPPGLHTSNTGKGATVIVVDSGVQPSARLPVIAGGDLITNTGGLFDCDDHGTLVASIIGAHPSKADSFVGVAPSARIVSVRALSKNYQAHINSGDSMLRTITRGILNIGNAILGSARAYPHSVINVSLGTCIGVDKRIDPAIMYSIRAVGAAIHEAFYRYDSVIVAAAGNTHDQQSECRNNPLVATPTDPRGWGSVNIISVPSIFPEVISVDAIAVSGKPAKISDISPWISLSAPGDTITALSAVGHLVNGILTEKSTIPLAGTSFAAPYVSGIAALVRSKYPHLNSRQVKDRLLRTARGSFDPGSNATGMGVVDPIAALTFDIPPLPTTPNKGIILDPPYIAPSHNNSQRDFTIHLLLYTSLAGVIIGFIFILRAAGRKKYD